MAEAATMYKIGEEQPRIAEQYAHSLSTIRYLGRMGRAGLENSEAALHASELAWTDFITGIQENLKTDEEFRPYLDVESKPVFQIVDGKARTGIGEEVEAVLERGLAASRRAALGDPCMQTQVIRDEGDLLNLHAVNRMAPGTTRFAVSVEPKKELRIARKYWRDKGYRENIAYLQTYCKDQDGKLWMGAYSIDFSDVAALRELFMEMGEQVPEDVTPNTFIRYGFERELTPEQTEKLALEIRRRYYDKVGAGQERLSVTEYADRHKDFLGNMFRTYMPALGDAVHTGHNNTAMRSFAEAILRKPDHLEPELIRNLIKICNSQKFDDEAGRTIEAALRYAAVEYLRKGLTAPVHGNHSPAASVPTPKTVAYGQSDYVLTELHIQTMNHILAQNIDEGAQAGRSYGGCSPITMSKNPESNNLAGSDGPQSAFGGKANGANTSTETGECDYLHEGCYCCPYDNDGRPLGRNLTVRAKRKKDGSAHCLRPGCGAELNAAGRAVTKGHIYEKALRRKTLTLVVDKSTSDTAA